MESEAIPTLHRRIEDKIEKDVMCIACGRLMKKNGRSLIAGDESA